MTIIPDAIDVPVNTLLVNDTFYFNDKVFIVTVSDPVNQIFDGVEVNINQYREKRPKFRVPGIKNLYLVGDSTAGKGAGGDIGHNSVWDTYYLIQKEVQNN